MPSYVIEQEDPSDGNGVGRGKMTLAIEPIKTFPYYQQAAKSSHTYWVTTSRRERIPVVWVKNAGQGRLPQTGAATAEPIIILHCHGNATDIGIMMGPYYEMTKQLGVEVVGVEYSGYGASSGKPSARNSLADVEAAYDFIVSQGVSPSRIVAYGQSVGSGPALYLAAKKPIGGVVLHSPMLSGIKVIDPQPDSCCKPSCVYCCFDFFHNDKHMKTVQCPAFVIHGRVDEIIPLYHGLRLAEAAPKPFRWPGFFPKDAGHNDIVETNSQAYFRELLAFVRWVQGRTGDNATVADGKDAASMIGKPAQMQMQEASANGRDFQEPIVGPADGRYAQLRGGTGHAEVSDRGTRE